MRQHCLLDGLRLLPQDNNIGGSGEGTRYAAIKAFVSRADGKWCNRFPRRRKRRSRNNSVGSQRCGQPHRPAWPDDRDRPRGAVRRAGRDCEFRNTSRRLPAAIQGATGWAHAGHRHGRPYRAALARAVRRETEWVDAVAMLATDPAGIHLRASDQVKTYRDLVADLKARPGQRRISGSGRGAIWHLAATRWQQTAGIGLHPWVAATSPREAIAELAAGDTDIVVCSLPEARGTSQGRAVKTIAVMNSHRSIAYPAVPALSEAGVRLDAGWWRGIAGPPGLSSAARTQLAGVVSRAYVKSALSSEAHARGFSIAWADGRAFGRFMAREDEAMGAALRAAGIG